MKKIALMLVLLASSGLLHSEEIRYVNDVLVIQLRTGPSFNHRNFKGLTSGTKLTLLETSDDEKWSHVKTPTGEDGWVPTQYLSSDPAARDVLKVVRQQLDNARRENDELKQQLADVTATAQAANQKLDNLNGQNNNLSKELDNIKSVSANAIQLNSDNKRLLQENQELKNRVDVLGTDNQRLKDARNSEQFMNGAFAVLIGVFITLLVPRLWPKKRSDWA